MVNVDVDVQYARMVLQQLKDCDNYIIDITKTRRLALLCMMKSSRPEMPPQKRKKSVLTFSSVNKIEK